MRSGPASIPLALLLAASGCDTVPSEAVTRCETRTVRGVAKTDILFVVDDSGSMSEEQWNVRANLAGFVDRLANGPIENDFQIGVTTTSVDDFDGSDAYRAGPNEAADPTRTGDRPYPAGALIAVDPASIGSPDDGTPDGGLFLFDPARASANPRSGFVGPRILSASSPTLLEDFQANVLVGIAGSGKEQPFRAARLALTERIADGVNAGFLRSGARLAIVFVTDEDDCSDSAGVVPAGDAGATTCRTDAGKDTLDSVEEFAAFLRGPIGGEFRDVVVGVIAGVSLDAAKVPSCGRSHCANRSCSTAYDEADRLTALVAEIGGLRTRLGSICDASFADSLASIAEALVPQIVTLEGTPADWRMLAATVERPDGTRVVCDIAPEGDPRASGAGAVYSAPAGGRPATLTFQNHCQLAQGDAATVQVICAG